jgi:hypothetical protein
LLAIEADAVARKFADVAPALTVTEAGTLRNPLLLASATIAPPTGAFCESATVQVLTPPWLRLVGLQARVETAPDVPRLIVAVLDPPFQVPVMATL